MTHNDDVQRDTPATRPVPEPAYQVEKLREAAHRLGRPGIWSVSLPLRVPNPLEGGTTFARAELPGELCAPLRGILRAAAEQIERAGSPLGLPVSYALQLASVILGEDLGHNR